MKRKCPRHETKLDMSAQETACSHKDKTIQERQGSVIKPGINKTEVTES